MRKVLAVLLLGATACIPPAPTQPEPSVARTSKTVAEAIRLSAATLTADGFEIAVSDVDGGILTARKSQHNNASGTRCRWPKNSMAEISTNDRTITVSLVARRDSAATNLQVTSRVRVRIPSADIDNEEDCVSDGTTEAKLLTALGVTTGQ